MRAKSLADVAIQVSDGASFDLSLANFLDEFYAAPSIAALAATPPLLSAAGDIDADIDLARVQDAYLAATAEELARCFGLPMPTWLSDGARKLHRPWFASPLVSLRAVLLLESPPAFRARNLFVSDNALTRV